MSERATDQARRAGELTRHRERLDSRTAAPVAPTLGEGSTGTGYVLIVHPWGEVGSIVDIMVTTGVGQEALFPVFELKCPASRPSKGQDVQWRIGAGGVLEIIGGGGGGGSTAYYTGIIPTGWPVSGG